MGARCTDVGALQQKAGEPTRPKDIDDHENVKGAEKLSDDCEKPLQECIAIDAKEDHEHQAHEAGKSKDMEDHEMAEDVNNALDDAKKQVDDKEQELLAKAEHLSEAGLGH